MNLSLHMLRSPICRCRRVTGGDFTACRLCRYAACTRADPNADADTDTNPGTDADTYP